MDKKRVLVYGNSIILGIVRISLLEVPDLDVVSLMEPHNEAQWINSICPDVIIFDIAGPKPEGVLYLLLNDPNLLLIAINAENDQIMVWSGENGRVSSIQDLVRTIHLQPEETFTE